MKYVNLGKTDIKIPIIGQGTWTYGERQSTEKQPIKWLLTGYCAKRES